MTILHHLWQSTLFAVAAWGLTLVLRDQCARVRYWVWLAASYKFLVPFSLLTGVGAEVASRTTAPVATHKVAVAVDYVFGPQFATQAPQTAPASMWLWI